MVGSLLKIQWVDGTESVISPGAGSIRIESRAASSKGSAKKAPAPAKKQAKKKPGKKR
jgi:hypothetical protein